MTETRQIKPIEDLIAEYKIRFRDTDKIRKSDYPFYGFNEKGFYEPSISPNLIWTKYGRVYKSGTWATADLEVAPDKWVVEKDESHPMWERFVEWKLNIDKRKKESKQLWWHNTYIGENTACGFLLDKSFFGYQFITLDQWAEFFLPKYKVGDKVITKGYLEYYNGRVLTITNIDSEGFCYFKESEYTNHNFKLEDIIRYATKEEIAMSKIDFSILNDSDWFFIGSSYNYLVKGNIRVDENYLQYDTVYCMTRKLLNKGAGLPVSAIKELRLANEDELKELFDVYPELNFSSKLKQLEQLSNYREELSQLLTMIEQLIKSLLKNNK